MCSIQTFVLCDWADDILALRFLLFLFLFLSLVCLDSIGLRRSVGSKYFTSQCLSSKLA